jgi:hypothetical protein
VSLLVALAALACGGGSGHGVCRRLSGLGGGCLVCL